MMTIEIRRPELASGSTSTARRAAECSRELRKSNILPEGVHPRP